MHPIRCIVSHRLINRKLDLQPPPIIPHNSVKETKLRSAAATRYSLEVNVLLPLLFFELQPSIVPQARSIDDSPLVGITGHPNKTS